MHFFPRFVIALLAPLLLLCYATAQQLQCNPCSHGYGQVQVGASKQYNFQLSNTGTRTLHITSKSKTGPAFSFNNFPLPVTLRPGQSTQVGVTFQPTVAGKTTGTVTLNSDALNAKLVMNVWGTGASTSAPSLGASPSSLDFGNVTVGSTASLKVTLSAANGTVTVSSAQSSSSEFTATGLSLPLTLSAGQSTPVTVKFLPTASGTATASLTLTSNASNSPTTVPLTGVGVAAESHSADLSWNPSRDPVIGYNVYRGGTKGGPYTKINSVLEASTNYTDSAVSGGATYFYVATAIDANSVESGYSNEVKVVIPSP
jgi:hypothetical protein